MTRPVHATGRGRRPADALATARHAHGRPVIWRALRAVVGQACTVTQLSKSAGADQRTIRSFLSGLVAAGLVERIEASAERKAITYRLLRDTGAEVPRFSPDGMPVTQGSGRDRMWRTMKMLRTFSAHDLAVHASLPDAPVALLEAKDYTKTLQRAGYLALVKAPVSGRGGSQAVFRLVKNTGPQPPQIQRCRALFDPNLGTVMWTEAGQHG